MNMLTKIWETNTCFNTFRDNGSTCGRPLQIDHILYVTGFHSYVTVYIQSLVNMCSQVNGYLTYDILYAYTSESHRVRSTVI